MRTQTNTSAEKCKGGFIYCDECYRLDKSCETRFCEPEITWIGNRGSFTCRGLVRRTI